MKVLRAFAILFLGCFSLTIILVSLRQATWSGGRPAWLDPDSPVSICLNVLEGLSAIVCWGGGLYAWTRVGRLGTSGAIRHIAVLPLLVILGLLFGAFYILVVSKHLTERVSTSRAEGEKIGLPIEPR